MKKLASYAADKLTPDRVPEFEEFYQDYPRRTEKAKALALWKKMTDEDRAKAYRDVEIRSKTHRPWVEDNGRYICSPRRYLLNQMWNDSIEPVVTREARQLANEDGTICARFWTMLIQFYGKRLIANYGETMPPAWQLALRGMSQDQAVRILADLANKDDPRWLPSLPEIKLLLRYSKPEPELKMLPRPWPKAKVANPAFTQLRKILKYRKPK